MGGKGIKWHRKGIKRGRKGTKHHRNGMKLHWKAAKMGWKSYKLADFKRKGEILTFSSQNTLAQGRHLDILLKLGFFYSILIEQWYFGGKWADVMARCGDFGDTWGPWGLCSALLHLESYFLLTHHHKWAEMGIVWATFWASFLKTESRHHDGISRAISTIFFPKFSQHRWQTLRFFFFLQIQAFSANFDTHRPGKSSCHDRKPWRMAATSSFPPCWKTNRISPQKTHWKISACLFSSFPISTWFLWV